MTGADTTSALSSVGIKKALEVLMSNVEHQKALALMGTSIPPKKNVAKSEAFVSCTTKGMVLGKQQMSFCFFVRRMVRMSLSYQQVTVWLSISKEFQRMRVEYRNKLMVGNLQSEIGWDRSFLSSPNLSHNSNSTFKAV